MKEQQCVSKGMTSSSPAGGGELQHQHRRPGKKRTPRLGQWGASQGGRGRESGRKGGRDSNMTYRTSRGKHLGGAGAAQIVAFEVQTR